MKKLILMLALMLGIIPALFAQETLDMATKPYPKNSSYTGSFKFNTQFLGTDWTANNFNNNSLQWSNIRCGRKGSASVGSLVSGQVAAIVTEFVVNVKFEKTGAKDKLNSAKLYISSNASFSGAAVVSYAGITAGGDWSFPVAKENQRPNQYYKIEFDCQSATNNGFLGVNKLTAYTAAATGETVENVEIDYEVSGTTATVTLSCATEGATIFYGFAEDAITTEYTAPFTVTESCTVYAKAQKGETESATKSKDIKLPYSNFKDAVAAGVKNDPVEIIGNFAVLYQNGDYLMLTDGTSNILVYKYADKLEVGTAVSSVSGVVDFYSNLYEIKTATLTMGGEGASYEPYEVTELASITKDKLFDMVTVKGCSIIGKNGKKANLVLGSETIALYDNFNINFDEYSNCDVTGFVWINNNTIQITPVSVEEAITPAPEVPDSWGAEIESTEEGLSFPALPSAEGWTAMYSVNEGDEMEANAKGTIHYATLDPATLHTIKVWYKHENGTTSDAKEFYYLTDAAHGGFTLYGEGEEAYLEFDFGTIGEGVTVYFTLNGTDPVAAASEVAQAPRRAATDGIYHITTLEEMDAVHALTAETTKVHLHYMAGYDGTPVLKHMAVHTATGTTGAIISDDDISTGLENVTISESEAIYFNLQGVRVDRPSNGIYIRLQSGKATKIAK